MTLPHVEIRIENLVLRGVAERDAPQLRAALEAELARMAVTQGVAPVPRSLDYVSAGHVNLRAGSAPEAAGRQVARAVFGSLPR